MPTSLPRVMANLPKDLYAKLLKRAKEEKVSISKLIVMLLQASLILLISVNAFCFSRPDQMPGWDEKAPEQKKVEIQKAILMEEERFDKYVLACLQTFDNHGMNYNDDWHEAVLLDKAVHCANLLMYKTDKSLHPERVK